MKSYWIEKEGVIKLMELFENNFIDPQYFGRDLPDDFFQDIMENLLQDHPDVVFNKLRSIIGNIPSTFVGSIDITADPLTIVYGARDVIPPRFKVVPDFEGALIVMEFIFKWFDDETTPFPFVPVANPPIPHNVKELAINKMDMEVDMTKKGAILFDPSYDIKVKEALSADVLEEDISEEKLEERMKDRFLFSSRHGNIPDVIWLKGKCIAMTFNPTHPMSVPYIIEVEKKTYVINECSLNREDRFFYKGTYRWGRRIRNFRFDPWDQNYRIHSDVWMRYYGPKYHYMAGFDMVGNFDFKYLLGEKLTGYRVTSMYAPLTIEPYSIKGKEDDIYSAMINDRGYFGKVYGSSITTGIEREMNDFLVWCEDVTKDYTVFIDPHKGHLIVHIPTGREVYVIMPKNVEYKRQLGLVHDSDLYFDFSYERGLSGVFKIISDPHSSKNKVYQKLKIAGGFFLGKPGNRSGCLIEFLDRITLLDAIQLCKKDPEGFLPYSYRMPAMIEETLTYEPDMEEYNDYDNKLYYYDDPDIDYEH